MSADDFKNSSLLPTRSRTFAVAWIDPRVKKSIKHFSLSPLSRSSNFVSTPTSAPKLHSPLPSRILRNPRSSLTIQILTPRLPFCSPKLVGAAFLPLSSARIAGDSFVLPLRRLSGGQSGTVRIAVRLMWFLDHVAHMEADEEAVGLPFIGLSPSAPPLHEGVCVVSGSTDESVAALNEKTVGTSRNSLQVEDGKSPAGCGVYWLGWLVG